MLRSCLSKVFINYSGQLQEGFVCREKVRCAGAAARIGSCRNVIDHLEMFKRRRIGMQSSSVVQEGKYSASMNPDDLAIEEEKASEPFESTEKVANGVGQDPGKYSASVKVDASFLRFVSGKRGQNKEKIEHETHTKLHIPKVHEVKVGSPVVINGHSQVAVDAAVARIQTVINEVVNSPSLNYSHFISLPLAVHPLLLEKVTGFRESVLDMARKSCKEEQSLTSFPWIEPQPETVFRIKRSNLSSDALAGKATIEQVIDNRDIEAVPNEVENGKESQVQDIGSFTTKWGIDESIFVKPATFHLTVIMLKLWNNDRINAAAEILQKVQSKVYKALEGQPIAVRIQGLKCMSSSPAKAHVLYANIKEADGGNRLVQACQAIIDEYIEAGLVLEKDINQELKLHATLMNTIQRKRKTWKRIPFDARPILLKYGKDDWGEYPILGAHLSQRFSYSENGYYHCCASIDFPASAT